MANQKMIIKLTLEIDPQNANIPNLEDNLAGLGFTVKFDEFIVTKNVSPMCEFLGEITAEQERIIKSELCSDVAMVSAVKYYRSFTGQMLKQSKERIDEFVAYIIKNPGDIKVLPGSYLSNKFGNY